MPARQYYKVSFDGDDGPVTIEATAYDDDSLHARDNIVLCLRETADALMKAGDTIEGISNGTPDSEHAEYMGQLPSFTFTFRTPAGSEELVVTEVGVDADDALQQAKQALWKQFDWSVSVVEA
jgi:hypothetical protein